MADRKNYYYKQTVTEAELDAGFDNAEAADRAFISDQDLSGIFQGATVAEAGVPDLTVDVLGPAVIYDQLGQRIFWSPTQNINCAIDEDGAATTVAGGGNAKILTIFAEFDRLLSDSRVDGNGATIYFDRDESFKINVVQGAEATSGSEVAPALRVDQIALCDITLLNGQVAILNADIDITRREDSFVLTGTPNNERAGTTRTILQAFQDQINAFIAGGGAAIAYSGGANWADGTTNPATTIELQLDKLIDDLISASGAAKINTAAAAAWADGTTNPAERLDQRIDSIISDLAAGAGAAKIAIAAGSAWHDATTNPAERLDQRVDSIITDLTANNGADRIGVQASTPSGIVTAGGSIHDALNELDAAIDAIPAPGVPGVYAIRVSFHKTLGPGTTTTNDMRVQLDANEKVHQPIHQLPEGKKVTGIAFYGEHNGSGDTATVELYRQAWGSVGGTLVGSFTTTAGVGNIVGSDSFAGVTIQSGDNWFVRVTNDDAVTDTMFCHSIVLTISA